MLLLRPAAQLRQMAPALSRGKVPATSMTAVTANSNMLRIRSYGSSLAFERFLMWLRGRSHRLWLSARALEVNTSGSEDLWLSATGAVVNGGRAPAHRTSSGTTCSHFTIANQAPQPQCLHRRHSSNVCSSGLNVWYLQLPPPISVFRLCELELEGNMKPKFALFGLLSLAVGLVPRPASAIRNGLPHANQITNVEKVALGL
jgi:hypothetical protein